MPYSDFPERLIKLIAQHPDGMTVADMEKLTDRTRYRILKVICNIRKRKKKAIYIKSWTRYQEGEKPHIRPVYAIGKHEDAPKPEALNNQRRMARWRAQQRAAAKPRTHVAASIFQLHHFL